MKVKLSQAEVKALCHYAKTKVLTLAQDCSASTWVRPGAIPATAEQRRRAEEFKRAHSAAELERFAKIEEDDMLGALEVYGVLAASQLAFAKEVDWPEEVEAVEIKFSPVAREWLAERRQELRSALDLRRGSIEIDGGTRNETFCLFVLDTIAEQSTAVVPGLRAA